MIDLVVMTSTVGAIAAIVLLALGAIGVRRENAVERARAQARLAILAQRATLGLEVFPFTVEPGIEIVRRDGDALVALPIVLTRIDGPRVRWVEGTPVVGDAGIETTLRAPADGRVFLLCEPDLSRTLGAGYRDSELPPELAPRGGTYVIGESDRAVPLSIREDTQDLPMVPLVVGAAGIAALSAIPVLGWVVAWLAAIVVGLELFGIVVTRGAAVGFVPVMLLWTYADHRRAVRAREREDRAEREWD